MIDKATSDLWWKNAVVYCVDVRTWLDSDGDGIGDLAGLTRRIDYLAGLGVTCLWLLPFYPSGGVDEGYDVTDYYAVDPRIGTLGDFVELVRTAREAGLHVIVDLVLNHTSDQHPWFQEARRDPDSRRRGYYVWSDEPLAEPGHVVFPGEQEGNWRYDEMAGQWYLHRYYPQMPDLNFANPEVRDEMNKVMGFWIQAGVSGFRVDSVPFLIETIGEPERPVDGGHGYLRDMCMFLYRRRGDAVMLGEANIAPAERDRYFGITGNDEMQMLFDFCTCAALWLSISRGDAEPLRECLSQRGDIPAGCQYVNFLRHHDELSFESLTPEDRTEVMDAFAPDHDWRIYERGIRRRMAPLLGGDERKIRLAQSLTFGLPGTPMIMYGDEIGLGDDLELPGRLAVRGLMQWADRRNGGFSRSAKELYRPVKADGPFGYRVRNVRGQMREPDSLLNWTTALVRARRQSPEIGWGEWRVLDAGATEVLAHRCDWQGGTVVLLHNLCGHSLQVRLPDLAGERIEQVFGDAEGTEQIEDLGADVLMRPYGYRWFRVTREGLETGL